MPDDKFCRAIIVVHNAFVERSFSLADEDKLTAQSAMPIICQYYKSKLPSFYTFTLPVKKSDKYDILF
jgi:hypothetical protein